MPAGEIGAKRAVFHWKRLCKQGLTQRTFEISNIVRLGDNRMPRKRQIKTHRVDLPLGRGKGDMPSRKYDERVYTVWYTDDSRERLEAVRFFRKSAACLFPAMGLPAEVEGMPFRKANDYLRQHPFQERWSLLSIKQGNPICDNDLLRLQYLPELQAVHVFRADISDEGVKCLLLLRGIERLVLYSDKVTDGCLRFIRQMKSLRSLDLQGSPGVSRSAFHKVVRSLPEKLESWPPPDRRRQGGMLR